MDPQKEQLSYQIDYFHARELILAMIRLALMDLYSSVPFQRRDARDWLIGAGLSLAEEVHSEISLVKMTEFILAADRAGGKKLKRLRNYEPHASM